jgi:hypothetical protein
LTVSELEPLEGANVPPLQIALDPCTALGAFREDGDG